MTSPLAITLASLLAFGPPADADAQTNVDADTDADTDSGATEPAPADPDVAGDEPAGVTYEQAASSYANEDYALAAKQFAELAEREPSPEHFFALGQALRLSGDCDGAQRAYFRYASTGVGADQVDAVEELMSDCEEPVEPHYQGLVEIDFRESPQPQPEGPAAESVDVVDAPKRKTKSGTAMWATGIALTALGGAGFVAGVGVYTWAFNEFERADEAFFEMDCDAENLTGECQSLFDTRSEMRGPRTIGVYTILLTPVLIGGGVALTVIGGKKRKRALVSMMHTPGGAGLMLSGRF